MPGFFGRESVQATCEKQRATGKVTTGTLKTRGALDALTDVPWGNLYVYPLPQITGIGGDGYPNVAGRATLYRMGETVAPVADDKLVDGSGRTWQIIGVNSRLNADEAEGFAVYDCDLTD
jgi:hypothetical protein